MPSGKVHTTVTLIVATGYMVGTIVSQDFSNTQYVIGAVAGVMIHPDLDVNHGNTYSSKIIKTRMGIIPHFGWNSIWYLYRRSLKHGTGLSHFPVISTLGRLAYLFLFVIVLPYLVLAPVLHLNFWTEISDWAWWIVTNYKIVLGLVTVDLFHWGMDLVHTDHKRRR